MIAEIESPSPVLLLSMVDNVPYNLALVASPAPAACVAEVHDTALHVLIGLGVACNLAIVSFKLGQAVVPVYR